MAANKASYSVRTGEGVAGQKAPGEVVAHLQDAVVQLERAVSRLQDLAKQPGFESLNRLLSGYAWAIEQAQELNEGLELHFGAGSFRLESSDPLKR